MKYIKLFDNHLNYLEWKSNCNEYIVPNVSACIDRNEVHFNKENNYLTFTSNGGSGSVRIAENGFDLNHENYIELQYSTDNGVNWSFYNIGDDIIFDGFNTVKFKGKNDTFFGYSFIINGELYVSGDITSVLNEVGGDCELSTSCFYSAFYECPIITPPNLPSTILNEYCYQEMFSNCTSLQVAPKLPAIQLADYCYNRMFAGCTSLREAPELPAKTLYENCYGEMFSETALLITPELPAIQLADGCYAGMFSDCESLETARDLPATRLTDNCYEHMFHGCVSLTTAPELPATQLAQGCYSYMFYNCTSLTTAPKLPATQLANYCYDGMFLGCLSLRSIICLTLDKLGLNYTSEWVKGVPISNDCSFYRNRLATWDILYGDSFIPGENSNNHWTVFEYNNI